MESAPASASSCAGSATETANSAGRVEITAPRPYNVFNALPVGTRILSVRFAPRSGCDGRVGRCCQRDPERRAAGQHRSSADDRVRRDARRYPRRDCRDAREGRDPDLDAVGARAAHRPARCGPQVQPRDRGHRVRVRRHRHDQRRAQPRRALRQALGHPEERRGRLRRRSAPQHPHREDVGAESLRRSDRRVAAGEQRAVRRRWRDLRRRARARVDPARASGSSRFRPDSGSTTSRRAPTTR